MTEISRKRFVGLVGLAAGGALLGSNPVAAQVGSPNHGGYADAITHAAMHRLKEFKRWGGTHKLYVGEVGIPQNTTKTRDGYPPDEHQWAVLGETWYDYADATLMHVTAQEVSERYHNTIDGGIYQSLWMSPGYQVSRAKVVAKPGYQADLVKAHPETSSYRRGVNFSGGQAWDRGINTNTNPGIYSDDYWYPTVSDEPTDPNVNGGMNSFEYLYSQGVRTVRLGARWERLQPVLGGPLSDDFLRYKQAINNAIAAGLKVVLDPCHNYGGYWKATTDGADKLGKTQLNTPGCTISHFVDFWERMSLHFGANPGVVAFDLMNEPMGVEGVAKGTYATPEIAWQVASRLATKGIRDRGDNTFVWVPVHSGIESIWRSHPNGPWIPSTFSNYGYTAHQYFDAYRGIASSIPTDKIDPDTGTNYAVDRETGGGKYDHSYDSENIVYEHRGF